MSFLKILRVYPFITEGKGGMENHIRMLSLEQQKMGHEVTVLYSQGHEISSRDICVIKRWPYKKIRPQAISIFIFHMMALCKLVFNRKKFNIIHLHGDWSSFFFSQWYKYITGASKVVFSFHGQVKDNFAHRKLLPLIIQKANVTFVNGYDAYNKLHLRGKVVFRPSGVDELFYENGIDRRGSTERFKVITVGNLNPAKNMLTILKIAKRLPEIEFSIVGRGPELEYLKQQKCEMEIENVNFLGFLTKSEIKPLFDNSDIFLLCSLEEGTPTVVLEAMAVGLPIITSGAGGISSIINEEENGFVINEFSDVDSYVYKLRELIASKILREKIRSFNMLCSYDYKWPKVAELITDYYIQ